WSNRPTGPSDVDCRQLWSGAIGSRSRTPARGGALLVLRQADFPACPRTAVAGPRPAVSGNILLMTTPIGPEAQRPNPALELLSQLVGVWRTSGTHPLVPGTTFH